MSPPTRGPAPRRSGGHSPQNRRHDPRGGGNSGGYRPQKPTYEPPLPRAIAAALPPQPSPGDNLGLWLDKLLPVDTSGSYELKGEDRLRELQYRFEHRRLGQPAPWENPAAAAAVERLRATCRAVYGEGGYLELPATTEGRLLVDYGRVSLIESSLSFAPTLGVPRIPGSALKGMLRAFCRENPLPGGLALDDLFGAPDPTAVNGGGPRLRPEDHHRGRLVFHDALPLEGRFQLSVDVLTPHAGKYYRREEPPGDWLSPIPHTFLTVVDTTFSLFVGLLPEEGTYRQGPVSPEDADGETLAAITAALREALWEQGVGAKRAAAYGRLVVPDEK